MSMYLELVQKHEREWGQESYPNRPTLAELLASPLVVMWIEVTGQRSRPPVSTVVSNKFRLTCYQSTEELNTIVLNMITTDDVTKYPAWKISRLFINQKPAQITGVKLQVQNEER